MSKYHNKFLGVNNVERDFLHYYCGNKESKNSFQNNKIQRLIAVLKVDYKKNGCVRCLVKVITVL